MNKINPSFRPMCYRCNRSMKNCLCHFIHPVETKTRFVILMHPKEYKHIKNNTGRLTNLSLPNSQIFVGVDFSHHKQLNEIINNQENYCAVLFPSQNSINLNTQPLDIKKKKLVIFVIDATWSSAKPILRLSQNLQHLPKVSFSHTKTSKYSFKKQPFVQALSTMESVLCILEILHKKGIENFDRNKLEKFLLPFEEMIKFQLSYKKS